MPATATDRLYGLTTSVAVKPPCRVATTVNITLSGEQTIDGVAVVEDDRVLVKNQADPVFNGIYTVSTSAWQRTPDFDGARDAVKGTIVLVIAGIDGPSYWELTTADPVVIGTSPLTFRKALAASSALIAFLQSGAGAVERTAQDKMRERVSVKDFGAVGDGVTDDTAAIDSTHAAFANVYYPPGTYVYNGTGITRAGDMRAEGAGRDLTTILIGAGKYWLDPNASPFDALHVSGFTFSGGLGAIRNRNTGTLVGRRKLICDNRFTAYTQCAINTNHNDNPYWDILRNEFDGANSTGTVGIALSRNSDMSHIDSNSFLRNKVHLKLDRSGVLSVSGNDFIQFDSGTARASIWATGNNFNAPFINDNKFGNENLAASDYRVMVVPELAGTYNGDKLPDFTTLAQSGTFQINIDGNQISGATGNGPLLYDVSGNLRGSSIRDNSLTGSQPSYLLHRGKTPYVDSPFENILIGSNYSEEGITVLPTRVCNVGFSGIMMDDPTGITEGDSTVPNNYLAMNGGRVGYVDLLTTRIRSIGLAGTAAKVGDLTDASGGADAAEFSVVNNAELFGSLTTAPIAGLPLWIEFDLQQGSASPVTYILADVYNGSSVYWERRCKAPATWQTFRFNLGLASSATFRFRLRGVSTGQIKVGRLRVYQSRSPVAHGVQIQDQLKFSGGLGNYANDAAAATGGVQINELYRNGGAVQIRLV